MQAAITAIIIKTIKLNINLTNYFEKQFIKYNVTAIKEPKLKNNMKKAI